MSVCVVRGTQRGTQNLERPTISVFIVNKQTNKPIKIASVHMNPLH